MKKKTKEKKAFHRNIETLKDREYNHPEKYDKLRTNFCVLWQDNLQTIAYTFSYEKFLVQQVDTELVRARFTC